MCIYVQKQPSAIFPSKKSGKATPICQERSTVAQPFVKNSPRPEQLNGLTPAASASAGGQRDAGGQRLSWRPPAQSPARALNPGVDQPPPSALTSWAS